MTPLRILVTCVAENDPGFHLRVETLIGSLRQLGGSAAGSPVLVNMVESVDPAFARRLEEAGAAVRIVSRVDATGFAHANKLRMFDVGSREDFDVLLAVDCDVAVADDPIPHLSGDAIAVVPTDLDPFSERQWRQIFDGLGVAPPDRSVHAGMTGRAMYPYFNSGVVAVPRTLCTALHSAWMQALHDVDEVWRTRPQAVPPSRRFYADQVALALALWRGLPWTVASRELNFATHVELDRGSVEGLRPALLHYHAEVDASGFLLRPRSGVAEQAAERVNCSRARDLGIPYGGLADQISGNRVRRVVERLWSKARAAVRGARAT